MLRYRHLSLLSSSFVLASQSSDIFFSFEEELPIEHIELSVRFALFQAKLRHHKLGERGSRADRSSSIPSSSVDHALLIPTSRRPFSGGIGKWFRDLEISLGRPTESRAHWRTRKDGTVLTARCASIPHAKSIVPIDIPEGETNERSLK